jgi:broad specificity phosphatase PhoE
MVAAACGLPLRLAHGLSEIYCGDVDGMSVQEVQRRYPEAWARNMEQSDPEFCWPGGETHRAFRERVLAAFSDLAMAHQGERIVLVTHAGVINQLLASGEGISPARWEPFRPRNGSMTEVQWQDGRVVLLRFEQQPTELDYRTVA